MDETKTGTEECALCASRRSCFAAGAPFSEEATLHYINASSSKVEVFGRPIDDSSAVVKWSGHPPVSSSEIERSAISSQVSAFGKNL